MHVRFGTYANNIGHIDSPGCFRGHDDNHTSRDGKKIGQDCDTCHAIEEVALPMSRALVRRLSSA